MDSVVLNVIEKFKQRSEFGQKKYGTNLDRTDLSFLDWVNHMQEELMDAILYCERLRKESLSEYQRGYMAAAEVYNKMYDAKNNL